MLPGQGLAYLVSLVAINCKTHNATAFSPRIAHRDTRQGIEALAQHVGESGNARPDVVKSPGEGVVNGHAEANLPGIIRLPVLKAPGIRAEHQAITRYPLGSMQIHKRWFEPFENAAAHVEQASATRAAQIFATRGREHVTADRLDVHRHLPHRLAGVE